MKAPSDNRKSTIYDFLLILNKVANATAMFVRKLQIRFWLAPTSMTYWPWMTLNGYVWIFSEFRVILHIWEPNNG